VIRPTSSTSLSGHTGEQPIYRAATPDQQYEVPAQETHNPAEAVVGHTREVVISVKTTFPRQPYITTTINLAQERMRETIARLNELLRTR
jgi:hypothetical protein